ncbi:hypothetical protein [Burkholderia ubonensis]|uniref:hypothetical protein n=1 Tax=Burkholderia ubonensis TaxID=101571 RepID=UPI000A656D6E|nr:hypothetical protein [Burkholderia ubonensis]
MMKLIAEDAPIEKEKGCWEIAIRCVTDIRKGGHLSMATPYSVTFSEDRSSCTQAEGVSFAIDLVIDRIESYGREWDLLYSGMTAKISVVGDASSIPARAYLAG